MYYANTEAQDQTAHLHILIRIFTVNIFYRNLCFLKTHILCLLAEVVHHYCTQYTALIVVAHIKG